MPDFGYVQFRRSLRNASFRGVHFYVQMSGKASGRRTAEHQYPKNGTPYSEDIGRRMYRFTVVGYIIGPKFFADTFEQDRDNLEAALEDSRGEGPGVLVLPTRGLTGFESNLFTCTNYRTMEREQWGGYAEFEMQFSEAGKPGIASSVSTAQAMINAGSVASLAAQNFLVSVISTPTNLIDQVTGEGQ